MRALSADGHAIGGRLRQRRHRSLEYRIDDFPLSRSVDPAEILDESRTICQPSIDTPSTATTQNQ
ncbi:MAG: hypothetical protein ACXW0M_11725 [Methylosarcina sp.]